MNFLLFPITILLLLLLLAADCKVDSSNFLASFTTRSLIRVLSTSSSGHENNNNEWINSEGCLEVEEFYDRKEQLGKLTVQSGDTRTELYVRLQDDLYYEAQYNLEDNSLRSCTVWQKRPNRNTGDGQSKYFWLFNSFTELAETNYPTGQLGYLIGPASLLYLFREELQKKWKLRAKNNISSLAQANTLPRRENIEKHHRIFVDSQPIELSLKNENVVNNPNQPKVSFRLSNFPFERSRILRQLAPFAEYTDTNRKITFHIDYLSANELNYEFLSKSRDPFKISTVFSCSLGDNEPLSGRIFSLEKSWSFRLAIDSDWLSTKVYVPNHYPEGVDLALDLSRHLIHFDILSSNSKNVLDMEHKLVYHMPNEPSHKMRAKANENSEDEKMTKAFDGKVKNDECSIVDISNSFNSLTSLLNKDKGFFNKNNQVNSLKRWNLLLGNTNSIVYLGKTRYKNGHLAHEFELVYEEPNDFSAIFILLVGSSDDWKVEQTNLRLNNNKLIGKFWIQADSCSQSDLYTSPAGCLDPILLASRMSLINLKTMTFIKSEEIQFSEFKWTLEQDGLIRQSIEMFNLKLCPLNKLELNMEVRWMRENEESTQGACLREVNLDDFVAEQWLYLMDTYVNDQLSVVNMERQSIPGIKLAKYSIELAETPKFAIKFTREESQQQQSKGMKLLAQINGTKSLFKCLTWASRFDFGKNQKVFHSPKSGDCLLYSADTENENVQLSKDEEISGNNNNMRKADKQQHREEQLPVVVVVVYDVYARSISQIGDKNSHSLLPTQAASKMFLSEQLHLMNEEIVKANKFPNQYSACVSQTSLAKDIRFGQAKIVSTKTPDSSIDASRTLSPLVPVYKSGYKFVVNKHSSSSTNDDDDGDDDDITMWRNLKETKSLSHCLTDCNEEPACAAFAYCNYPESGHQYCQLSEIKLNFSRGYYSSGGGNNNLNNMLESDSNCEVRAKDYLLLFEYDGTNLSKRDEWHLVAGAQGEQDCAGACYMATTEKFIYETNTSDDNNNKNKKKKSRGGGGSSATEACTRFIYCKGSEFCFNWRVAASGGGGGGGKNDSYGQQELTQEALAITISDALKSRAETNSDTANTAAACQAYKRKTVSLYRASISFKSPLEWSGENLFQSKLQHLSKDKCADKCTHDVECQSFDSCLVTLTSSFSGSSSSDSQSSKTSSTFNRLECVLLSGSMFDDGLQLLTTTESDGDNKFNNNSSSSSLSFQIKRDCTHYERFEAQKRLSAQEVKLIVENLSNSPKIPIDGSDSTSSPPSIGFYASTVFAASLLGLTIGVATRSVLMILKERRAHTSALEGQQQQQQQHRQRWLPSWWFG